MKYDWLGVAESYRHALSKMPGQDLSSIARIHESLSYSLYRFAMQADDKNQFASRCREAIESYRNARKTYDRCTEPQRAGCLLRCEAMVKYLNFWLSNRLPERRKLVKLSHELMERALAACYEAGDGYGYARTFNQLCIIAGFDFVLQTDHQARESMVRATIKYGEQAIGFLSSSGYDRDLAVALVRTALFIECLGQFFLDIEGRERCTQESIRYWLRATSICEEGALAGLLESVPVAPPQFWGIGTDKAVKNLIKGLEYAKKTKDRFAMGCASDWLAFNVYWKATMCANADEASRLYAEALKFAHDAKLNYLPISFVSTRGHSFPVELADSSYSSELSSRGLETQKEQTLLEVAEKTAREGLERYENAGYPLPTIMGHYQLGKALLSLSKKELDYAKRRNLLEEALLHVGLVVDGFRNFLPFHYFDQGFMIGFLANVRRELAELAEDEKTKISILEEAAVEKEHSVELGKRYLPFYEKVGSTPLVADFCRWELEYGDLLNQLYSLTKKETYLRKEIEVLRNAAKTYRTLDLPSRTAESYWKLAQIRDMLGEKLKASREFEESSKYYLEAARKMPTLKAYYEEYASYMEAWSEIEKARYYHTLGEYGSAKGCFEKAARMHESLEHWNYLSSNYCAWACVESGEELSIKGKDEDSVGAFCQAADLFSKTQDNIRARLDKMESSDEKQMANELLVASDQRRLYCEARICVEKARIKEKKGDYRLSAEDYSSAIETLDGIVETAESDADRRELRFIIDFCKACMKMMMAEDLGSPELYVVAARQFEQAGHNAERGKSRGLALGHSRFCMALGAVARFVDTQDMHAYLEANNSLQSAMNYYGTVGLNDAVRNSRATELLLEAYLHMGNAKREVDPRKKAKLCKTTEIVLQEASKCYADAERVENVRQLQRLLREMKEEHELALLLSQVVRTSPIVTERAFATPQPTSEKAVGLGKFEHSEIQANIAVSGGAVVEQEVEVHLDIVNTGMKPCRLVKIDELIPSGMKMVAADPMLAVVENGSIDIKGKMLEPLGVESVKLRVNVTRPGEITLRPRIVFVDDAGSLMVCEPKPATIIVYPKRMFKSKRDLTERVFSFLVQAFADDYMKRKVSLQESGWRTLMQIVNQGHVPKSCVYDHNGGRRGQAICDLQTRGLVETRIFGGERGRGGSILRIRVFYEKEAVKRYVDQEVLRCE